MKPPGVWIAAVPCMALAILTGCSRGEKPSEPEPVQSKPHVYNRVIVLCIGINEYQYPGIRALSYAEPDARGLAQMVRSRYGYETFLLLGKDATREAIGAKLREYAARLGEKDVLLVYFAGHGQVIELPSHGRAGFLVPFDANLDLNDRSNPDAWSKQGLDMRQIVELIGGMKAHHVVLIADACASGFMTGRGNFSGRPDLQVLLTAPSRMVMAAATERQQAGEDDNSGHGRFTSALLDVLKSPDAASVTDVFNEVRKRVIKDSTLRDQWPQLGRVGGGDGEFVFIPLAISPGEVQLAFEGKAEHALGGVYARALARVAERTTLGDVFEAFEAVDYRFSTRPREREKAWRAKVDRFRENAQTGDVLAMAGLFYCHSKGLGVEKDEGQALHWSRLAYDSGQPAGRHLYGACLLGGVGVDRNEEAAWRLIREASDQGFAISQFALAGRLIGDQRIDPMERVARAYALYEEAAKAGLASAMAALADLHAGTLPGTKRDVNQAIELLNAAAGKGLPRAKATLYDLYSSGTPGVPKDLKKARELLAAAAEDGFAPAQNNLACEYYQKRGVEARLGLPQDALEAVKWAELAARQNDLPSHLLMCDFYEFGDGVPADFAKAIEHCERAAKENFPPAFARQARWYIQGTVYPRDSEKAVHCARKAALGGDAVGCFLLGTLYEDKLIPPLPNDFWNSSKDFPIYKHHALHCYVQAAKQGFAPAAEKAREYHQQIKKNVTVYFRFFQRDYLEDAKEFERMFGPLLKD